MNRTLTKIFAAVLCLSLLLTACGGEKAGTPADPTDDVTTTGSPDDAPAREDASKYNAYIELSDTMGEMEDILYVYFQNVLYQEEFALAEGGDYANIKEAVQFYTGLSYTVEKAQDYAAEEPAYPEADAAVLALGDSVSRVMDALDHLGSYMRFDDFVEDDMARAPELHAELWAALETYDQYYPQFLAAIQELAEQSEDDEVTALLEEGELIRYNARMFIRTAQAIQEEILNQLDAAAAEDPDMEELPPIDLEALSEYFGQFQSNYEGLTAALDDEEQREKISAFTTQFGEESLKLYTNRVNTLYNKVGALAQVLLDGGDYSDAYSEVSEAVSDMIDTYNNTNS